jgi:hypothetical protein
MCTILTDKDPKDDTKAGQSIIKRYLGAHLPDRPSRHRHYASFSLTLMSQEHRVRLISHKEDLYEAFSSIAGDDVCSVHAAY